MCDGVNLSSLVAPLVVLMTTSCVPNDDRVGIMATLGFRWLHVSVRCVDRDQDRKRAHGALSSKLCGRTQSIPTAERRAYTGVL